MPLVILFIDIINFEQGLGITVFGIAYMFVHDGLVHKRFPVGPIANVPYFRRVASAHQVIVILTLINCLNNSLLLISTSSMWRVRVCFCFFWTRIWSEITLILLSVFSYTIRTNSTGCHMGCFWDQWWVTFIFLLL